MSELGSGNGSSYPGGLDTDSILESSTTVVRSDVPNDANAAIIAIETELGTDPAGSKSNVKTYLQTEHNADGTHNIPTSSYNAGQTIQVVNVQDGAVATGTTQIPSDDTIPQNTEGDEYMTLAVTPTSAASLLKIEVICMLAHSSNNQRISAALFQDSTVDALAVGVGAKANVTNAYGPVCFTHYMTAGTTIATTFKIRAGVNEAGTTTFNGIAAARRYGGVLASSITITEVAA